MGDTKHTPGPWRALPDTNGETFLAVGPQLGFGIAHVLNVTGDAQANAALIAAAPDLLAACKVALEYLAPVCISSQAVPNMLRDAIAKAEGQS